MVAITDLQCPIDGCFKVGKSKQGLSRHITVTHADRAVEPLATHKDGQVEINLNKFPGKVLYEPVVGGFWSSILKMPMVWGVVVVLVPLTLQSALTNPVSAFGLATTIPLLVLTMWWLTEGKRSTKVGRIRKPPDPDGRVRITFEWWPSDLAKLLPEEARRTTGHGSIYVIDTTGEKPIAFTPFTVPRPEFAIPVRGAMANQQSANEQLNKVRRQGISPEVVQQAFALAVIGGLILANVAVMGQLVEFLNQ